MVIIAHRGYINKLTNRLFTLNDISESNNSFKHLEAELWTAYMYCKRMYIVLTNTTYGELQDTEFPGIVKVLHSDAGNPTKIGEIKTDLKVKEGEEISDEGKFQLKLLADQIKHFKKDSISSCQQQLESYLKLVNDRLKRLNFKIVKDDSNNYDLIFNLTGKITLAYLPICFAFIIYKILK